MKTLEKITYYLRLIWFKKIKKVKTVNIDWGDGTKSIYKFQDNHKGIIAINFTQSELSDLNIPKATTHFYAKDTNIAMFPKNNNITHWADPINIKEFKYK